MLIKKALPVMPIGFLKSSNLVTNSEKTLLNKTHKRSLSHTPATKLKPPSFPLLILCLIMVKITGPTDIANKRPIAKPLSKASIITNLYNIKNAAMQVSNQTLKWLQYIMQKFIERFLLSEIFSNLPAFFLLIPWEIYAVHPLFLFSS